MHPHSPPPHVPYIIMSSPSLCHTPSLPYTSSCHTLSWTSPHGAIPLVGLPIMISYTLTLPHGLMVLPRMVPYSLIARPFMMSYNLVHGPPPHGAIHSHGLLICHTLMALHLMMPYTLISLPRAIQFHSPCIIMPYTLMALPPMVSPTNYSPWCDTSLENVGLQHSKAVY